MQPVLRPTLWPALLFGLVLSVAGTAPALAEPAPAPNPARAKELVHMVRQDCGACHGLTLKGGLGPALTAAALADRPGDSMAATILHGRPGTPMPPFLGIVSETEAAWIVQQLKAGFPGE
ncbi:MAG: cytochrome c [Betaproteobacteria bacterium]|nr:cytochrome c [Betaproteobacteria bacterium]